MVGVMKVMATSFKMTVAHTTVFSVLTPEQDTVNTSLCQRLLDTHTHTSLAQSLVGTLLLSPGSWCAHGCLCPSRVCFPSPVEVL